MRGSGLAIEHQGQVQLLQPCGGVPQQAAVLGGSAGDEREAQAQHPPVRVGETQFHAFEHYTERVVLQEGRHSVVVSAWHTPTSQPVVIKAYTMASLKPRQVVNVYREVRLLSAIQAAKCPGVVGMMAAFEDEAKLYIVFKACLRGDLYQLLMKEPSRHLGERLVATTVALPLVLTLVELHGMRIVHRDIKPENVFIDLDGRIQLGDFGLATQQSDQLTERVGTLDYMAPEVLAMPTPGEIASGRGVPQRPYNEKVDIWAIGCLCYEMLAGQPPFEVQDPKETAKLIMAGKPAPFPSHVSVAATDFIRQALAHKPSQRPSALQLLEHPWLTHHARQHRRLFNNCSGNFAGDSPGPTNLSAPTSSATDTGTGPHNGPHHLPPKAVDLSAWDIISSFELLQVHEQQQQRRAATAAAATAQAAAQHLHHHRHAPTLVAAAPPAVSKFAVEWSGNGVAPPQVAALTAPPRGSHPPPGQMADTRLPSDMLRNLPPGPDLFESSSCEDPGCTELCGGGDASIAGLPLMGGIGPTRAPLGTLRPLTNRRASSGTSEYLTYNTPRCSSPESITRSSSMSASTSPLMAPPPAGVPTAMGLGLRGSTSCNGTTSEGMTSPLQATSCGGGCAAPGALSSSGADSEPQPVYLTWQSSAPTISKKAVGKSRFAVR